MTRKILITLLVSVAGSVAFFLYDRWAAGTFEYALGSRYFRLPRVVSSAISSLSVEQVGLILVVAALVVAGVIHRGKNFDAL